MSMCAAQLEVLSEESRFVDLEPAWNALFERADGHFALSFAHCLLAWQHVAKSGGYALRCIVAREGDRLLMVWPFLSQRSGGVLQRLRPLTPGTEDSAAVLVDPSADARDLITRGFAVLRELGADIVDLPYVDESSVLYQVASRTRGLTRETFDTLYIARFAGLGDWDSLVRAVGRQGGRKPGKYQKQLQKIGTLDTRVLFGAAHAGEAAKLIDWMLEEKRGWAEHTGKQGGWLYSAEYRNYLLALVTDDASRARLMVITLDGAPLAVSIFGLGESTLLGLISGFDRRFVKRAPGTVLIEHLVRWALENGFDIDFGVGVEPYKAHWSRNVSTRVVSMQFGLSALGRAAIFARDSIRQLRTHARRLVGVDKTFDSAAASADRGEAASVEAA